jgi:hypothetical protein
MSAPTPPIPTIPKFSSPATRLRDTLMTVFRLALFVWAVTRVRGCHGGEDWWISVIRAFGWSVVKEIVVGFLNSIVLGLALLATSRSDSQVETLLKVGKAVAWILAALNVGFEVAFMTWATSC